MTQLVHTFGTDSSTHDAPPGKEILGGKGAGLAEMSRLGLPVPPGFTLTTEVCTHYYANGQSYPEGLRERVAEALGRVEAKLDARFGDAQRPLLVSVRSGARASMPGMMDTILNLGLNDQTVEGLARESSNPRFAFDSYRRFVQMYGNVVLGIEHRLFEDRLHRVKLDHGARLDTDLDTEALKTLVHDYRKLVNEVTGSEFPQDVQEQLWGAISAVFASWMNPRAIKYRELHELPDAWGTAVNVQAMVFGNRGERSATGVAFTRDPATGEKKLYGEFLMNAQGEDVVAGIRTPQPLSIAGKNAEDDTAVAMEEAMPEAYRELTVLAGKLETHFRDMQDIEFTVQDEKLWILQTRNGKRTARASLRVAVELANEGLLDRKEAVCRVEPSSLDQLMHPRLDPNATRDVLTRGLPASPGSASGAIVFNADEAEAWAARKKPVILVRTETSPEDIHGMIAAKGIVTSRGGMTSHAAVVARGMGRPCVCGASGMRIDERARTVEMGDATFTEGDMITIDGATGEIMRGKLATIEPEMGSDFATLMAWADELRRLGVRANADKAEDATLARRLGAEGIGLCRTEHMFFDDDRIVAMRQMILAEDEAGRRAALARILPMQRSDFAALFRAMEGLPVTVRLLDPPLHEFLPHTEQEVAEVAKAAGVPAARVRTRSLALKEANPMLGHRGCRLGLTYPEIYEMQVRALLEAAIEVERDKPGSVKVEIMVPLIATRRELEVIGQQIREVAGTVQHETGMDIDYLVGTMIELPRAALTADQIAKEAEFFSFGTNDLTQTTLGLSRDDAGSFLGAYKAAGIFEHDPFVSLDEEGVGELIQLAQERGRKTRANLKTGLCGEHGGDPRSIALCHAWGLDYVSCSPYRVPVARLAAAQAAAAGTTRP